MNTDELLAAVASEFPELTAKTLRDWMKEGFLTEPARVGLGYKDGVMNEWGADSVDRIRILKSVTTKRIDKTRSRRALLAAGYFVGVVGLRDALLEGIEAIDDAYSSPKKFDNDAVVIPKKDGVFDNDLRTIIYTALVAPTPIFDKYLAVIREYGLNKKTVYNRPHSEHSLGLHEYEIIEEPVIPSPLTEVLEFFSIYQLERDLSDTTDALLLDAFNEATNLFNIMCPIVGWLYGYDCYPTISNTSVIMRFAERKSQPPKMERYEFEYLIRLVCIAGCIVVRIHRDKFLEGYVTINY